jgi:hypothetical protein
VFDSQGTKDNEDLINFLEHKLEEIEKKYHRTQTEFEALQQQYHELHQKTSLSTEKYKRAALLMTEFLDDMLNQTPNILDTDLDMHLNLEKIKETPVEHLPKQDKVALVLVLLKQLQPYLSASNLSMAPHLRNDGGDTFVRNKADDVLRQHGAAGSAQEVDALQGILNNINVQTRSNG